MSRISSVTKMHIRDRFSWFYLPWIILLSSFAVNLIVGLLLNSNENMYTGGIVSIYIYILVIGMTVLSQTFPLALGLSIRRADYFWGTAAAIGIVSAFIAILLQVFAIAERLTDQWGLKLYFFNLPYLSDGSILTQLGISFIISVHCFFFGFMITCIHRRFGVKGLFAFLISLFLLSSIGVLLCTYYHWWGDVYLSIIQYSALELALWTLPFSVMYAWLSYVWLRKSTV